ncbi:MAG TPA: M1 family metallopeptidase, partial [Chitinophagaceae bacterium]
DSRASTTRGPGTERKDAGFHVQKVEIVENGKAAKADYLISDTRMQVRLPEAVKGNGGKLQMTIRYNYTLQASGGGGRSGYLDTRNGHIYDVSYWYPRMAVYDDLRGWNTLPFLGGGEFYMDYGNIDYRVTLPAGMIVAGSGELQNPREVLTSDEIEQLNKAKRSDKTILIHSPESRSEAATRGSSTGWLTWHFKMNNTRDVAWAASRAFRWDAARINLPEGKTALAMSVYPEESKSDSSWGRATEYLKNAVEIFSKRWYVYPYPVAINVGGPVGGMEYPGITFDWWQGKGKELWALLAHEIGHNWYPMLVGSNERRDAWMDEGFNTFVDIYASDEFNHGEYAPKRDGEYAPKGGNPAREIVPMLTNPAVPPILTNADAMDDRLVHPLEYYKTALGLVMLREIILGKDRFDYAFRTYTRDWAFRHPSPMDFFRTMENAAGEDLGWFWREWFLHNWALDQAVKEVKYVDNDPSKGALITLENLDKMAMPVTLKVTESGGKEQLLHFPVEIWQRGGIFTFKYNSTKALDSVVLDPGEQLPDANPANNVWKQD